MNDYETPVGVAAFDPTLLAVLDALHSFVGILRPSGELLWCNRLPLDLLGLTLENVAGKPFAGTPWWLAGPIADRLELAIRTAAAGNAVRYDTSVDLNGTQVALDFSLAPVRDEKGAVQFLVAGGIDITGRVRVLSANREAATRAQEESRMLSRLVAASLAVSGATSVREALDRTAEQVRSLIGAHQAVASVTAGPNFEQSVQGVSLSDKYAAWRSYDVPPDGSGIYRLVCASNQPMRMTQEELESHPAWCGFGMHAADHPPMRGWLAAPLLARDGGNLGIVQLSDKHEGEFTLNDELIVTQLAHFAAGVIENRYWLGRAEEQRRIAESALAETRNAEKRYRRLIETAEEGIWLLDARDRTAFVNRKMAVMLGYTEEEMLGRPLLDFISEDSVPVAQQKLELRHAGEREQLELIFHRKDGTPVHTLAVCNPIFDEPGAFAGALAMVTDITARVEAEQQIKRAHETLQAVIEASPLAIFLLDTRGTVLSWNPAAERMFGWTAGEAIGNPVPFIPPSARAELEAALEIGRQGQLLNGVERRRIRRDGSPVDIQIWSAILRNDRGEVEKFMTVCADVTERKILEEKLRIAQRMEAIGQLAGGVAHDFNNLLTVINGYALMLESQPEVARLAGPELRQILHAGQRAATLTQQLLAFSRHQTVEPRPVDLTRLIRNMDAILTRLLRPDIEVEVQLADALPAVSADPTQMEQVVLNLALNAADAMPDGGRLTIGTRPSGEPRPSVVLVVRDTGSGMSQEVQSRIFEPFFTTKPAGRGTGLGLATVDRIVRQAGGTIKVVSAPGQGSEFAVSLPALPTS